MSGAGTPPMVPMWPQPYVGEASDNPFPFFPFNPHWGEQLDARELEAFCALLRLAWVSQRPCMLPADPMILNGILESYSVHNAVLNENVLARFDVHPQTGMLYLPAQLRALERLISGVNMYALLWEELV